uniref:Prenyl transferase n=2 Tax=Gracilariopsis TaxID=2781 RepID=A0A1C9CEQ9_9FLOR|nr:prenyl transferase [Gracilariopsis lemaneiformis]YP_009294620.1 prenyl transferase [Gracilariopsis chorda]AJO68461.1 prenyl transferase [Gracilariopsis lemaneiformis]AML79843.1 prenyl transferase [Gracilariopsis lemaneiformis]AOM66880.1 prenyl transferase [Gracilariopsis chorda]
MTKMPHIVPTIQKDLLILEQNLKKMVSAKHPILYAAAEHLFSAGGKRIRPTIILLVALSTTKHIQILPEHKRLAEITEIIHTASLVHDDVVDECQIRRGVDSVHSAFSTKIAILAGDFLFAQSSWYLANLNNLEVVKTISKVITDFAEGEITQGLTRFDETISIDNYIEKSFYKTASLIAASCKGAAMLSETHISIQNNFYLYGKHLGLAFQIIDDILDIIGSKSSLGKPAGSDLKNGNLTAPLIFALEEKPKLHYLINREFQEKDDINTAIKMIKDSHGIQKAYDLAQEHIQASLNALNKTNTNKAQESLAHISNYIINRLY